MYVAGITCLIPPKVELIVWGSTMGIVALSTLRPQVLQPVRKREVKGRSYQAWFRRSMYLDHGRAAGTIFYVHHPAVRLLGGCCEQQVSPPGVDDKTCSPFTSRRLWN